MPISAIHASLSNTALLYFLAISLWGFWRFFRRQGVDSAYWGTLVIAELLILAQIALGIYMWTLGLRPARPTIHILYGVVLAMMIPGAYVYTSGRDARRDILVYGTATIIAVGLITRSAFTGAVPLP
ncbi:MAG: hypothetical protein DWQ07_14240 [Chloroflexi bacterium]|nr:MAG: hypothetical protein DWQ07_14240 [Chloroflexota bacterium]MBL1195757.1 hypothetical protein [Chloroflexota bacterium]NOH13046.1 hypothetical protein [Chloroflexota bacterium]